MTPVRITLSRKKGARLPAGTVNVARGPGRRWGNPFVVGEDYLGRSITQARAVLLFRCKLEDGELDITVEDVRSTLAGKNLACFCGLDDFCHADVLLDIANPELGLSHHVKA